jgi:hypothetical protein
VKVTARPNIDGFRLELKPVAVFALFTVCEKGAELLVRKLPSPTYVAVMVWAAAGSADVVRVATPLLIVPDPIETPLSRKLTVPVGAPAPGETAATAALKVTA